MRAGAPSLRPAQPQDCDLVWRIHNDPVVRRQSIRRAEIELADHRRWFAAALDDPNSLIYIACEPDSRAEPVGVLRFDLDPARRAATISIALASEHRGRGLGRAVIAEGTRALLARDDLQSVAAFVRPGNAASLRAFEAAGYVRTGAALIEDVELLRMECTRVPVLPGARAADVLLRCDGNATIGWGHAMRCLSLADGLDAAGLVCAFGMRDPDPHLAEAVRARGHALLAVEAGREEAPWTIESLRASGACVLVLDSYAHDADYLEAVGAEAAAVRVVLDDLADRVLPCELVLNANPLAEELDYGAWGDATLLLGPAYAPLRGDVAAVERGVDGERARVLVTLGGSRLGARAVALARALDALEMPFAIDLLLGARDAGEPDARALAEASTREVAVHAGLSSIAPLLARASLAVSAGGTTCFELAACGVPALLLVAAANQRRGARAWQRMGAFELLGELDEVSADEVAARVADALADRDWLAASSARGRQLVDGRGAARAAAAIAARIG